MVLHSLLCCQLPNSVLALSEPRDTVSRRKRPEKLPPQSGRHAGDALIGPTTVVPSSSYSAAPDNNDASSASSVSGRLDFSVILNGVLCFWFYARFLVSSTRFYGNSTSKLPVGMNRPILHRLNGSGEDIHFALHEWLPWYLLAWKFQTRFETVLSAASCYSFGFFAF